MRRALLLNLPSLIRFQISLPWRFVFSIEKAANPTRQFGKLRIKAAVVGSLFRVPSIYSSARPELD